MRDLLLVLAAAFLLRTCEAGFAERTGSASVAATPRAVKAAGTPLGGEWSRHDSEGRPVLLFSEPGARPVAGIACDLAEKALTVERMTVRPSGSAGTMTILADNRSRRLAVLWDGASLPIAIGRLDLADRMVDSLAKGRGPIRISLGAEPELVLPGDPSIAELIAECRG